MAFLESPRAMTRRPAAESILTKRPMRFTPSSSWGYDTIATLVLLPPPSLLGFPAGDVNWSLPGRLLKSGPMLCPNCTWFVEGEASWLGVVWPQGGRKDIVQW